MGCRLGTADTCQWVLARGNFVLCGSENEATNEGTGGDERDGKSGGTGTAQVWAPKEWDEQERFFRSALTTAAARGAPMLVTNPDLVRPGSMAPMPGKRELESDEGEVARY